MSGQLTYNNVFAHLLSAVPEYGPTYDKERAYYGEVIPHVFMGTFTQFVRRTALDGDADVLRRSLAFMEAALASRDAEVVNLAAVSFVENLSQCSGCRQVLDSAGPLLRKEFEEQYGQSYERQ